METRELGTGKTPAAPEKVVLIAALCGIPICFAWVFGLFLPPCVDQNFGFDRGVGAALYVAFGYSIVYLPFMFVPYGIFCIAAALIVAIPAYFRRWPASWTFGILIFVISIAVAIYLGDNWSHFKTCKVEII